MNINDTIKLRMSIHSYILTHTDPSPPRNVTITRVFQDGVELNWLPPTEPNGEVHYVVEYKREDSGSWTSVNTASDSTHYNLTRLHSGASYIIRVVAVSSVGRAPITPTPTSSTAEPTPTFNSTGEDDKGDRGDGSEWRLYIVLHTYCIYIYIYIYIYDKYINDIHMYI